MPVTYYGPLCARRGCPRPEWEEGLCHACFRLARLFHKDPRMFAFKPLQGYRDERDSVEVPWESLESGIARLLGEAPDP